jgi:beta-lactamase superfamily II metal-dependent hydrolase
MQLQIFDVEHGACSLLTADNFQRLMIDCGHNASTGWRPGTYLKNNGISTLEMLAITNYDEDHASASSDLFDNVDVRWLWRNKSVSAQILKNLKSDTGMGPGIDRLVQAIDVFTGDGTGTAQPVFQGLNERNVFYNNYPVFDDENNLSMALYLRCHGIGVMFTGDLEIAGFDQRALSRVSGEEFYARRFWAPTTHDQACASFERREATSVGAALYLLWTIFQKLA